MTSSVQQENKTSLQKVSSLQNVVDELKHQNLVSDECALLVENPFTGVPKVLMARLIAQKKKNPGVYPPELRAFGITLKFYCVISYGRVRVV